LKKFKDKRKKRKAIPNKDSSSIEDRQYTVFRGTSPLSDLETGMKGISFQTWGESDSMRFATVPMQKGQAWFVTTSDPRFRLQHNSEHDDKIQDSNSSTLSSEERKQIILNAFKDWHDPIIPLIESTPANDIMMENAIAHQFSMGPLLSLHNHDSNLAGIHGKSKQSETSTAEFKRKQRYEDEIIGRGPILCFVGDANMTVDPVLAQGFTMAMEDASLLSSTIQKSCIQNKDKNSLESNSLSPNTEKQYDLHNLQSTYNITSSGLSTMRKNLTFNPRKLRSLLANQYIEIYEPRLLCLLRATELVQMLAQPTSHFTVAGALSKYVVRPSMQIMPNLIKKPIFDFIVKYSLGIPRGKQNKD